MLTNGMMILVALTGLRVRERPFLDYSNRTRCRKYICVRVLSLERKTVRVANATFDNSHDTVGPARRSPISPVWVKVYLTDDSTRFCLGSGVCNLYLLLYLWLSILYCYPPCWSQ
jgi:hypothetical protein